MFVYKITFSFHVELVNFLKLGFQILEIIENRMSRTQSTNRPDASG